MDEPGQVCIYCKGDARAAKAQEHVVPHALGNEGWVLPKGTVCDPCNNYFGGKVDSPFVNAGFGDFKSLFGVPGKKGPTKLTLSAARATALLGPIPEGATVTIQGFPMSEAASKEVIEARDGSPLRTFPLTVQRPPRDRESAFLSRLLLASIGALLGPDCALLPELDLHRENMRSASPQNYLPFSARRVAEPVRASWILWFCREGVAFEMWGMFRYGIAIDGKDPELKMETRRGFSLDRAYQFVGGPEMWPVEEWARRLGPEGQNLLKT